MDKPLLFIIIGLAVAAVAVASQLDVIQLGVQSLGASQDVPVKCSLTPAGVKCQKVFLVLDPPGSTTTSSGSTSGGTHGVACGTTRNPACGVNHGPTIFLNTPLHNGIGGFMK